MKKSILNHVGSVLFIALIALFMISCRNREIDKTLVEYTFPGEWEERLIWPHDYGIITPEYVDMIDDIWATMTKALHTGEKVHIVVYNQAEQNIIGGLLTDAGVDMSQVDFTIAETDPDKEIIPINGEILAVIGGGIHCVTQQQPDFGNITFRN